MYMIRAMDGDGGIVEMCVADVKNLQKAVSIFEMIKRPFKVSNGGGYVMQHMFGWGGYNYWRINVGDWDQ